MAAPPALPGCHCQVLPQPGGAWNTLSILPGAGTTSPQPARGPRDPPVWYPTAGRGLSSCRPPWEVLGDKQTVFSACLSVCPGEICLVFPRLACSMSPEPAVGPGGGSGQNNPQGMAAALSRQPQGSGTVSPRTPSTLQALNATPAQAQAHTHTRAGLTPLSSSPRLHPWPPGQRLPGQRFQSLPSPPLLLVRKGS